MAIIQCRRLSIRRRHCPPPPRLFIGLSLHRGRLAENHLTAETGRYSNANPRNRTYQRERERVKTLRVGLYRLTIETQSPFSLSLSLLGLRVSGDRPRIVFQSRSHFIVWHDSQIGSDTTTTRKVNELDTLQQKVAIISQYQESFWTRLILTTVSCCRLDLITPPYNL